MIAANVAAARELIRLRHPTMFRIHDEPDPEKIADLREILAEYGVNLAKGQVLRAKDFNAILASVRGETHEQLVNRSEEHTSELKSLMRISYAVFCSNTKPRTHPMSPQKYNKQHRNQTTRNNL